MHEMTEEAFSEQWLIAEGFEDDSTMASENRASVDVEKDELRNALVNAFSPTKKVQEFYKSFIWRSTTSNLPFRGSRMTVLGLKHKLWE